MIIAIISDTHGTLRQDPLDAIRGVDHIIHAGDIGSREIITTLQRMAPVTAVRGNTDRETWADALPSEEMLTLQGTTFYILHDLNTLDLDPAAAGIQVVISGHTHQPVIHNQENVLYLNPGSASQRRRGGPLSIGRITLAHRAMHPEIILLDR